MPTPRATTGRRPGRPRRPHVDDRPPHATRTARTGSSSPPSSSRQARRPASGSLAITDHDTLAALPRAARRRAAAARRARRSSRASRSTPSTRPTCPSCREGELHILGLGVDPDDDAFEAALAGQRQRRRRRFERSSSGCASSGCPSTTSGRAARLDRRRRARPADGRPRAGRGGSRDERRGRVRPASSARGRPAYVPRQGLGPRAAIEAIRAAGGLAVLAHFAEAPDRAVAHARARAIGLGGLEVYYRDVRRRDGRRARGGRDGAAASLPPAAATTMATRARTPRRTPSCGSRPTRRPTASPTRSTEPPAGPRSRTDSPMTTRSLPVLDLVPPDAGRSPPRDPRAAARRTPASPSSGRTSGAAAFHVWTLGCQMNQSDSEEMAGRLLAAGCAEAPAWSRPTSS